MKKRYYVCNKCDNMSCEQSVTFSDESEIPGDTPTFCQYDSELCEWVFQPQKITVVDNSASHNNSSRAICGMKPGGSCPERIADVYYCGEKNDSACVHKQQA